MMAHSETFWDQLERFEAGSRIMDQVMADTQQNTEKPFRKSQRLRLKRWKRDAQSSHSTQAISHENNDNDQTVDPPPLSPVESRENSDNSQAIDPPLLSVVQSRENIDSSQAVDPPLLSPVQSQDNSDNSQAVDPPLLSPVQSQDDSDNSQAVDPSPLSLVQSQENIDSSQAIDPPFLSLVQSQGNSDNSQAVDPSPLSLVQSQGNSDTDSSQHQNLPRLSPVKTQENGIDQDLNPPSLSPVKSNKNNNCCRRLNHPSISPVSSLAEVEYVSDKPEMKEASIIGRSLRVSLCRLSEKAFTADSHVSTSIDLLCSDMENSNVTLKLRKPERLKHKQFKALPSLTLSTDDFSCYSEGGSLGVTNHNNSTNSCTNSVIDLTSESDNKDSGMKTANCKNTPSPVKIKNTVSTKRYSLRSKRNTGSESVSETVDVTETYSGSTVVSDSVNDSSTVMTSASHDSLTVSAVRSDQARKRPLSDRGDTANDHSECAEEEDGELCPLRKRRKLSNNKKDGKPDTVKNSDEKVDTPPSPQHSLSTSFALPVKSSQLTPSKSSLALPVTSSQLTPSKSSPALPVTSSQLTPSKSSPALPVEQDHTKQDKMGVSGRPRCQGKGQGFEVQILRHRSRFCRRQVVSRVTNLLCSTCKHGLMRSECLLCTTVKTATHLIVQKAKSVSKQTSRQGQEQMLKQNSLDKVKHKPNNKSPLCKQSKQKVVLDSQRQQGDRKKPVLVRSTRQSLSKTNKTKFSNAQNKLTSSHKLSNTQEKLSKTKNKSSGKQSKNTPSSHRKTKRVSKPRANSSLDLSQAEESVIDYHKRLSSQTSENEQTFTSAKDVFSQLCRLEDRSKDVDDITLQSVMPGRRRVEEYHVLSNSVSVYSSQCHVGGVWKNIFSDK